MPTPISPSGAFGGVGRPGMELWESNTYVTASNPGWPGQNVYVANQAGQPIPVSISGASGSFGATQPTTDVTGSYAYTTTSRLILAANGSRVSFKIYNDTANNYVISFGLTASLGRIGTVIPPYWTYEESYPGWRGPVAGIGVGAGSGTIYFTEFNP